MIDSTPAVSSRPRRPRAARPPELRLAVPRFSSTPPATRSYGPAAIAWATRYLRDSAGRPVELLPWQRDVLNAILAADGVGRLVHRTYLVGCARQQGKSTIMRVLAGWLLDASPWGGLALGAAFDKSQAGIIYRQVAADFRASADLRSRYKVTDHFGIRSSRSEYRVVSAESRAARGYSARLVVFDEVMTSRSDALWSALFPATSAVGGMMVALSTAGDDSSTLLRTLYDRMVGIERGELEADPSFGYTWFEAPGDDPDDPANLEAANPSLVEGLLALEAIRAERGVLSPQAFARERLNRWTSSRDELFPGGEWTRAVALEAPKGRVTLAVDAPSSWERATVAVAVRDGDRVHVEIARDLRAKPGAKVDPAAAVAAALELVDRYRCRLVYEGTSAIAPHLRDAAVHGRQVVALGPREVRQACGSFHALALAGRLTHLADPLLDQQLANAARSDSEGDWRFVRKRSSSAIDALLAATFAAYAATEPQPARPRVHVYRGGSST